MKVCIVLLAALTVVYSASTVKFTTKYDNVSIDEILRSDRLLKNYFDCLMDRKKCSPDGAELKRAVPLALKTECAGCSEKQKIGAEKVVRYIIEHKPEEFKELEAKYDPEGIYRKRYSSLAQEKGIPVPT